MEWLRLLTTNNPKAIHLELLKCRHDPWYWLRAWVLTEDAHSKGTTPFQPFPDKPHLYYLTKIWLEHPRLLIPKSRQMTITWLIGALYLWEAMFFPSRLTFFQSKKEEDAAAIIDRVFLMYQKLPQFMQLWCPAIKTATSIKLKRNRSKIIGIPQGASHARSYTCSGYFADEMGFSEEMDDVLAAVSPSLGEKGRFTGVSSAAPSYFQLLCFDRT